MKKFVLFTLIILCSTFLFSQSLAEINVQIKELKQEKVKIESKIRGLQSDLYKTKKQIKSLEEKKKSLQSSSPSSSEGTVTATVNSLQGILRDKPTSLGDELARIKEGEKIIVYNEHYGLYLKVKYKGQEGYLNYSSISENRQVDRIMKDKDPVQNSSTTVVRTVDKNDPKYKRLKKIYGADKAAKMVNGELFNGMSHGMVIETIGKPNKKTSANSLDGLKEVWYYKNKEVTCINGELDSWK